MSETETASVVATCLAATTCAAVRQALAAVPDHEWPRRHRELRARLTRASAEEVPLRAAKLAVLEGDPTKAGSYTMRLWMPDGYTIPPHFHLADEHVTVVEGTFLVGMGGTLDPSKFAALPVGSFGMLPPRMQHFARARGVTVIQLHGMGPWGLSYVNSSDDPRKKAR